MFSAGIGRHSQLTANAEKAAQLPRWARWNNDSTPVARRTGLPESLEKENSGYLPLEAQVVLDWEAVQQILHQTAAAVGA